MAGSKNSREQVSTCPFMQWCVANERTPFSHKAPSRTINEEISVDGLDERAVGCYHGAGQADQRDEHRKKSPSHNSNYIKQLPRIRQDRR
jgi:hypothetical protein